uniref:Signal peptidase complex catalytic subunit SEC11 n=2 Tax=Boreoeutheria TaxID=1437010 RepID=A0A8B7VV75_CASCN|nr:signal peptidase complex catalytic subunit SEC11A isoform X1 [Castor canadensis]
MLSLDFLDDVRRMNKRQLYYQVLNFGMIVSSALMIWKGLMVVTGSESPIVVVLSGSMEPAFHRGDLLFLTNRVEDPIRVGEIVVFRIEGREIPIVHRVLKIHEKQNGHIKFLTKGDNNAVDDRGLYKQGQHWLEKKDVVGRARGFVPYIGIVTILMNDYPKFKPNQQDSSAPAGQPLGHRQRHWQSAYLLPGCAPLLPAVCPPPIQKKLRQQALPPPGRVCGSLVRRKVPSLPFMRTDRWERWRTFPLGRVLAS